MGEDIEITALVTRLYEEYAHDVLRVSYFYLGDREKAEDIMQEVFLKVMEKKPTLIPGKEKAWLLTVALNLCRDLWRSGWIKRVMLGTPLLEMIPDHDHIEQRLEKQALLQAIHTLSPPIREVFLLYYYQGYTIDEISEILKIPPGTISSRLSRGRTKLKELLEEGGVTS